MEEAAVENRASNRPLGNLAGSFGARLWLAGTSAGLVAGMVELIPVLLAQASLGVAPLRVFQSIAGGLLGAGAYAGGVFTALLGLALHLTISVVAGLLYAAAASRSRALRSRPVLGGLAYGAVVFVVMTRVVVPLSAAPYEQANDMRLLAISLAVHMLAFGLPISLVCARFARRLRSK